MLQNHERTVASSAEKRFTLIWHSHTPNERQWIEEIFSPYFASIVTDTDHKLVMDDCIVCDAFIHTWNPKYYASFRGKNAFLIHFLDESYEGHYDLYQNFKGVFRNFDAGVFNPAYVKALPLGFSAGVAGRPDATPALERRYIWSLTGQINKATRPDVVSALRRIEPHLLFPTDEIRGLTGVPKEFVRRLSPGQYARALGDSIFAPCPMGNINIESYRVYEALECGAIPIVERRFALDYYRNLFGAHPLPTVSRWSDARDLITRLLKKPDAITALQRRCADWWKNYKVEYSREIGAFLATLADTDSSNPRPMYSPRATSSWWKAVELLRHHDRNAIARRVRIHARRLSQGRRFRNACASSQSQAH